MEMVPMMTQPQDATVIVPAMATAGTGPTLPGLSAVPLPFAAMLQEMLSPVPTAAEPAEIVVTQVTAGKPARPGKTKSVSSAATSMTDGNQTAVDQSSDPAGNLRAQLLAMAAAPVAVQPRPQPVGLPASLTTGLEQGERNDSPATPAEVTAAPGLPVAAQNCPPVLLPAGEAVVVQSLINPSPEGGTPPVVQMPEETGRVGSIDARPASSSDVRVAGDGSSARKQPRQGASVSVLPEGPSVAAEIMNAPDKAAESTTLPLRSQSADPGGNATLMPPQLRPSGGGPVARASAPLPVQTDDAPPVAEPWQGPPMAASAEVPAPVTVLKVAPDKTPDSNSLSFRSTTPEPVGTTELMPPQLRPSAGGPSVWTPAPLPVQEVVRAQTTAAPGPLKRSPGQVQGAQSAINGVQAQSKPAAVTSVIARNLTDAVPQVEAPAEAAVVSASPAAATMAYALFSGPGTAVRETGEAPPATDVVASAASPVSLQVEVVFADPTARGKSSMGHGKNEPAPQGKENEDTTIGLAVPAARVFELPDTNRTAPAAKVEEPGKTLHGSILEQVTTSVVSHDGKGNGTITVRLNPVELGELQIKLRIDNQQVKVEIMTDNRTVRDALMGNLDHLKETLLKQNLSMERFDVSSNGGNGFSQGFREERGEQRHMTNHPFGQEAVPMEIVRENGQDDWGVTDNSLVNLRL